jgi:hypothetical protein
MPYAQNQTKPVCSFILWPVFFLLSTSIFAASSAWAAAPLNSLNVYAGRMTSDHWEFNGLVTGRWEKFWWDDTIDTSLAFGMGPSYATDEPQVEIDNNGETSKFLIYWMIELALGLPDHPQTALILRLHHRSNAWGLINEDGGSNAIGIGMKYRY